MQQSPCRMTTVYDVPKELIMQLDADRPIAFGRATAPGDAASGGSVIHHAPEEDLRVVIIGVMRRV